MIFRILRISGFSFKTDGELPARSCDRRLDFRHGSKQGNTGRLIPHQWESRLQAADGKGPPEGGSNVHRETAKCYLVS